jgi:hypothetical protein
MNRASILFVLAASLFTAAPASSEFITAQVTGRNVGEKPPANIIQAQAAGTKAAAKNAEVASHKLADLLDSHWTTSLVYTLSGKKVTITATFDREKNAYIGVWLDGEKTPTFYDLKALLDAPGSVKIGGATYSMYLIANPARPLKSQIVLENDADEDETASVKVGKLLDGVEAAGTTVALSDQSYQLFYYRDVKKGAGGIELNDASKTYAFIYKDGKERHVFLIPAEAVRAGAVSVFKMFNNKEIGLKTENGVLKIYENP